MERYNYKFVWIDKQGKYQRYYVESSSKEAAIEQFKKETGLDLKADHIRVSRVFN